MKTERQLSEISEDFLGMAPRGKTFFASRNPVRTGGPLQVRIAWRWAAICFHVLAAPRPARRGVRRTRSRVGWG